MLQEIDGLIQIISKIRKNIVPQYKEFSDEAVEIIGKQLDYHEQMMKNLLDLLTLDCNSRKDAKKRAVEFLSNQEICHRKYSHLATQLEPMPRNIRQKKGFFERYEYLAMLIDDLSIRCLVINWEFLYDKLVFNIVHRIIDDQPTPLSQNEFKIKSRQVLDSIKEFSDNLTSHYNRITRMEYFDKSILACSIHLGDGPEMHIQFIEGKVIEENEDMVIIKAKYIGNKKFAEDHLSDFHGKKFIINDF